MQAETLILLAAVAFFWSVTARRLGESIVTPPMVALGLGLAVAMSGSIAAGHMEDTLHLVAEITLVIVLFSDAAMVRAKALAHGFQWPARMLVLGLPLAVALGFCASVLLLPDWPVWELALLAAILAPTDAALGQAVISNPAVPERIRRALTVESGVNDGLALPLVLFFGCVAAGAEYDGVERGWTLFAAQQIGLGALVGGAVGFAGAWIMRAATARGLTGDTFEGIGVLTLAALSYLLATELGGNGFLAAFAGGLAFGTILQGQCGFVFEFLETEGQLLVLGTFLLLGLAITPELIGEIRPEWIALILASLFVVRPLAIWLSLTGSDAAPVERGFMGWFGPRGLATALFALLVLGEFEGLQRGHEILLISFMAVLISALLHGVTAAPGARWIARRLSAPRSKTAGESRS